MFDVLWCDCGDSDDDLGAREFLLSDVLELRDEAGELQGADMPGVRDKFQLHSPDLAPSDLIIKIWHCRPWLRPAVRDYAEA